MQRINEPEVRIYLETITRLNQIGTINNCTGRLFGLSRIDIKLLACALAHKFKLSTGDQDIKDFAYQQFLEVFKGHVSALEMINLWIRKKLIEWNDERHEYISDWSEQNEHPQPVEQKKIFERLTKRKYPGS